MDRNIAFWIRWFAVFPGALLAGLLAVFPLHWVLYLTLAHGETISGVNIKPIEHATYPFVIALAFVLAGFEIAPSYKFRTSIILASLFMLFIISIFVLLPAYGMKPNLELRSIGPFLGLILGLLINWQRSRHV